MGVKRLGVGGGGQCCRRRRKWCRGRMVSAVVYEFEQGGGEEGLGFCQGRWRGGDAEEGFEGKAELARGEILWKDLPSKRCESGS